MNYQNMVSQLRKKNAVESALDVKENDVGIFVVDKKEKAEKAIQLINEEVKNYKQ